MGMAATSGKIHMGRNKVEWKRKSLLEAIRVLETCRYKLDCARMAFCFYFFERQCKYTRSNWILVNSNGNFNICLTFGYAITLVSIFF